METNYFTCYSTAGLPSHVEDPYLEISAFFTL